MEFENEKKGDHMRTWTKIIAVPTVLLALFFGMLSSVKPNRSMESAESDMKLLLSKAGGEERVCKEARAIFQRFGTKDQTPLSELDLIEYPAIASLGTVDGIWGRDPAFIKIRVGNHVNGYIIQIADVSDSHQFKFYPGTLKVGECIYVHR